jgi:hypothetical protein
VADEGRPGELTELLHSWEWGDAAALERTMPFLYDALRALASRHLSGERSTAKEL